MTKKIRLTAILLAGAFMCGQAYAAAPTATRIGSPSCGGSTSGGCMASTQQCINISGVYSCVTPCGNSAGYSTTGYCATGKCTVTNNPPYPATYSCK